MDAWCQDEAFLETADLVLKLPTGQELPVARPFLTVASPVIRDALRCGTQVACGAKRPREGEELQVSQQPFSRGLPCLKVEGSYNGWSTLLKFLYQPALSDEPAEMTAAAAFQILPIAHTYNMQALMRRCTKVVHHASLPLVAQTVPPSPQAGAEPNLLQWLALADSKQYAPLIQACLEQLGKTDGGGGPPLLRSTLANPQARAHLEQLCSGSRSGTVMELLNVFAGLPVHFKGVSVPDPSTTQPSCQVQLGTVSMNQQYPAYRGRLSGCGTMLVLVPDAPDCIQIVRLQADGAATLIDADDEASMVGAVDAACCGGRQMALGGGEGGITRLWDISPDKQSLRGTYSSSNMKDVESVCFCGEQQAACGDTDGGVRVCNLQSGAAVHEDFHEHTASVRDLKAAREGTLLLSASLDKTAKLWDLRSGSCVRTLEGHTDALFTADVDAQGKVAVTGSKDNTLRVWDLGSGRCTATLSDHKGSVCSVHMDAHGTAAVSASTWRQSISVGVDSELLVWDLSRAKLCSRHAFSGKCLHGTYASRDLSILATLLESFKPIDPLTPDYPELEYVVKVWSA